ncbi:MAG TPA: GNAT family N-acetyltransferase [Solirubrobacterales bacterium]
MSGSAELIADRGEAAANEEFFRSRPFLDAEQVTHTLRIEAEGAELLAPLIVRGIPDSDRRDAISPYGYPGLAAAAGVDQRIVRADPDTAPDPERIDFSATGLVSIFIRHALGDPPLAGAVERNVVQVADPELPPKSRPSDRNQINRNRRAGYEVRIVAGPETGAADRDGFRAAYAQTMRRASAAGRYLFPDAYFDRILESERSWLVLADAPDAAIAAGSIVAQSDGFLHYYLSGSTDAHLRDSPMKNLVAGLLELAGERRLPLNLGGGISRGDRLEEFKRGFANREQTWSTSEIICDTETYEALSAGRPSTGFFPAYRAS